MHHALTRSCLFRRWLLVAALIVLAPTLRAALAAPSLSMRIAVSVDGVSCSELTGWSGGDPRGRVGSGGSIVGVDIAPLVLEFPLAPPAPIQSWISSFLANQHAPHQIVLTEFPDRVHAAPSVELNNAMLSEVRFSGLDAATGAPRVTLVITSGHRSATAAPAQLPRTDRAAEKAVTFRLRVAGQPSSNQTMRVADFVIKRGAGGNVELPRLVVTLPASAARDWQLWRDAVLGSGPQPVITPRPESGSLEFFTAGARPTSFVLSLGGLLILRASPDSDVGAVSNAFEVELLCGQMAVAAAATPASQSTPPAASEPAAAPASTTDPATTPAVTRDRLPADPLARAPVVKPVVLAPGTVVGGADQGARDPADFPRPDGLVRQTFTGSQSVGQTRDYATYTAKAGYDEMLASYTELVRKAGWEQAYRTESGGTPESRMVIIEWHRAESVAEVRIYSTKTGSNVSVTVTTYKPGR